jgi:hypothetical protein
LNRSRGEAELSSKFQGGWVFVPARRAAAVAWSKQVVGNVEQGEAPTPFRVSLETRLNDISDQK